MPTPVVIALGGNQGDVPAAGRAALARLGTVSGVQVLRASRWYSTEPVGCAGEFLNAAALLHCDLTPPQLLKTLHAIEAAHGRVRTAHGVHVRSIWTWFCGRLSSTTPRRW